MLCYVISTRCQAYKNAFTFDALFLFESVSTEGSTTSSSSPAPSETLPLDVLRSTVPPAKSWLLFKLFVRSSFAYPESSLVSLSPSKFGGKITNLPFEMKCSSSDKSSSEDTSKFLTTQELH